MNKPVGFVAYCQCKKMIGATCVDKTLDYSTNQTLLEWLWHGCRVVPYFDVESHGVMHGKVEPCICGDVT